MTHTQWSLPDATPIVDRRPSAAQVIGLLVVGLILGALGAMVATNYADSSGVQTPSMRRALGSH